MPFVKYQHVEKLGTTETDGLVDLTDPCYVFAKIDGTNASVWCDDGVLHFGSRNRELSLDNDNAGFMNAMHLNQALHNFFTAYPKLRLYGEWLVPHTLKTYSEDAWRQFYVFDVCWEDGDTQHYMHYNEYKALLDEFGIEYIPALCIVERGSEERFYNIANNNTYLMQEGNVGEGIVIKRYGFVNKFGRTTWAKVVRNDFKAKHIKAMGPNVLAAETSNEDRVIAQFLTRSMVEKVHANIVAEQGGWSSKHIGRLLHTVFYDLVREECWNFVKALKNPKIDFGMLQKLCFAHTKQLMPELF